MCRASFLVALISFVLVRRATCTRLCEERRGGATRAVLENSFASVTGWFVLQRRLIECGNWLPTFTTTTATTATPPHYHHQQNHQDEGDEEETVQAHLPPAQRCRVRRLDDDPCKGTVSFSGRILVKSSRRVAE